jgi:hypothetical protein
MHDLTPHFNNHLFLSTTPHNNHSNNFNALLELLDPVHFMRNNTIENKKNLAPIIMRKLKHDLHTIGIADEHFPRQLLIKLTLHHEAEPDNDDR